MVELKEDLKIQEQDTQISFNRSMVELKECMRILEALGLGSFNRSMVELKVKRSLGIVARPVVSIGLW